MIISHAFLGNKHLLAPIDDKVATLRAKQESLSSLLDWLEMPCSIFDPVSQPRNTVTHLICASQELL